MNNFIRLIKLYLEFKAISQVKIKLRAKNQMNEITVFIYFICFAVVFGATFAFMWRMMTITLKDFDKVRNIHPELRDIKQGEELLVFKVREELEELE